MDVEELNLTTVRNTLKKIKTKIDYDVNDLMDFLNEDVTKSKAQEYIDLMSDLKSD